MYYLTYESMLVIDVLIDAEGITIGKIPIEGRVFSADDITGALLFENKEDAYALLVALSLMGLESLYFDICSVEP